MRVHLRCSKPQECDFRDCRSYKSAHIVATFDASSVLAMQIKAGAPADLFISADEAKMDMLEKAGLIYPETRRDLLGNSLVIVENGKIGRVLNAFTDLTLDPQAKIAIGQPATVPAGIYAKTALTQAGIWDKLQPQLVPCENVRAALAAVESGNAKFAIVYKSDAAIAKQSRIVFEIPESLSGKVRYPIALIKSPDAKDSLPEAKAFEDYLATPEAAAVFEKNGFVVLASDGKH